MNKYAMNKYVMNKYVMNKCMVLLKISSIKAHFLMIRREFFWHRVEKVIRTAQFHSAKPTCALRLEICDGKNL